MTRKQQGESPAATGTSPNDNENASPPIEPRRKTAVNPDAVQQEALRRHRQGWAVIRVNPGSKVPEDDWKGVEYTADEIPTVFPAADPERKVKQQNLGVRLGRDSGGLVVVDLDGIDPAIAALALPKTGRRDGRPGNPNSHWFYRINGKGVFPKVALKSPMLRDKAALEILGDGQQTVLPPSLHDSGEHCAWVVDVEMATVDADELRAAAGQAAAFNEIALLWAKTENRHESSLPLVGGLLRAGVDEGTIEALLDHLWPSAERRGHSKGEIGDTIESTAKRLEEGEPVTGWNTLRKLWGEAAESSLAKILEWLGVEDVDLSDTRPRVFLTSAEEAVLVDRTWTALQEANDPPRLFQRGGKIARVNLVKVRQAGANGEPEKIVPAIETLNPDALRGTLSRMLCWVGFDRKSGKPKKTTPSMPLVQTLRNESSEQMRLPVVSRVVSHPVFGPDGTLQTEPGYHAGSQTYLWLDGDLRLKPVPAKPTRSDMEEAKRLILDELLVDFAFVEDENGISPSMAHALALGLLPFGRDFIDGYTPMHFVEAPTRGTGKDLLVKSLGQVWNGRRDVPSLPQTGDEEEWRKVIVASMLDGSSFFYIANIKDEFKSRVLEQAITEGNTTGRLLKTNTMVIGEIPFIWIGTGNNALLGQDMARRVAPIQLDAKTANPYRRRGWKHTLPEWAGEHRSELLWAFLTLWQNWLSKGRPRGDYTVGSFQNWAEAIGGVLDAAGVEGFTGNLQEFQDQATDEDTEWQGFVSLWLLAYGTEQVKPSQLVSLAEQIDGFPFGNAKDPQSKAGSLSKALKARRNTRWNEHVGEGDKVLDGLTICMGTDSRTGRYVYWLETIGGEEREPIPGFLSNLTEMRGGASMPRPFGGIN